MSLRNRATPARSARAFAALTLAALGACATLGPVGGGTPASLPARLPPAVWVTVTGWPRPVYLEAPQVVGDSLIGTQTAALGQRRGSRVAVPLAAVMFVEEERVSAGRSVGLVLGLAVALAGLALLVVLATWEAT
jgi:hypothetical protein